jgi:uncharacterized protein (DUF362 family)
MFYQCPKCKKVWQHPLEKCLDCFLNLERIFSKKIKVIGISKVLIPTILHPKVPYYVLVLKDENKNRWVQKSIREYKIGEEFIEKREESEDKVAILRVKYDVFSAIEKLMNFLGDFEIKENQKILILPSLSKPTHPYFCENTNPKVLAGLIEYLIKNGAKRENIKVAAQSFNDIPIGASAEKSGLLKVCQDYQVEPLDLASTKFLKKEKDGLNFEISEEVFNSDFVINLPILKLDQKVKIKGALENQLKFLKKENYFALSYLYDQNEIILKLNEILPKILTIAEAISIKKETDFTIFLGVMLASFNPQNLDFVFSKIINQKDLPDYLKNIEIEKIPICGREIEELELDLKILGE